MAAQLRACWRRD